MINFNVAPRIKAIGLLAVGAVCFGVMQYMEAASLKKAAVAAHKGDKLMAEAIERARADYEDFFAVGVNPPTPDDKFGVRIVHEVQGEAHLVWVKEIQRRIKKAAFLVTISDTYEGVAVSAAPGVAEGSKLRFDGTQIIDWRHDTASGKKRGAFTLCVDLMQKAGRMDLNSISASLQLDCSWIPQLTLAQK